MLVVEEAAAEVRLPRQERWPHGAHLREAHDHTLPMACLHLRWLVCPDSGLVQASFPVSSSL